MSATFAAADSQGNCFGTLLSNLSSWRTTIMPPRSLMFVMLPICVWILGLFSLRPSKNLSSSSKSNSASLLLPLVLREC